MTDIIAPPTISAFPPAPQPTDTPTDFDAKAFAKVNADVAFVPQANALAANVFNNATATFERSEIAQAAASAASGSASAAAGSASAASGSASAAASSASTASSAAGAATAALTAMQVMYLGSKAVNSHPTTDNMGNPLQAGALYTNTGTNAALNKRGWWWDGGAWQLAWGDITGVYMPTTGGTFTGHINVPQGASGNQAPRANEVVQRVTYQSENTNLRNVITSGFHRLQTYTDGPSGVDLSFGQLIVSRGGDTIAQIGVPFNPASGPLVVRRGNPPEVGGAGQIYGWEKVLTSGWVVETEKIATVPAGTTTYNVDPSEGSVHYVVINGTVTFNLPAQGRQLGDQVTLRVYSNGGIRPIVLPSNVQPPVGQSFPKYDANQIVTIVFFYGRQNVWDCFYSGVHAA